MPRTQPKFAFILAGCDDIDALVPVDDLDTAGALSADGCTLVLVHVNGGLNPRRLAIPLRGWSSRAIVTDATRHAQPISGTTAPPRSVLTLVLRKG